jgi:hypothetical protein
MDATDGLQLTLDLYGHLVEGTDEAVAKRLDEMLDDRPAHLARSVPSPPHFDSNCERIS